MQNMQQQQPANRRKALYWLTGALSALVFWKLGWPKRVEEPPKPKTVKMLTKDGQLVEIDEKFLANRGQKVNTDEIHNWITKKN